MKCELIKGSSTIAEIGYDAETKVCRVRFASGGTYEYEDVAQDKYNAFLAAARDDEASTGKHFHSNFKGQHKYKKL